MIWFALTCAIYIGALVFYRPAPESLKGAPLSLRENFDQVKASTLTGLLLLLIYFIISRFSFKDVDEQLYNLLALNNIKDAAILWPLQFFTHSFIHSNVLHLLSNVTTIGLASIYERRVGSKRYMILLMVGSLSSIPSIFFYPSLGVSCGISGGVFALGAAFFTDHENISRKEWFYAFLAFVFLAVLFSIEGEVKSPAGKQPTFQVDYIGHLLGAIGGIVYCRLRPIKSK